MKRFVFSGVLVVLALPALLFAQGEDSHEPQWQLWKVNVDGTGLAPLADTPGYSCGSPKWSPDGKWVAYDTRRVGEQLQDSQITVVRADGTGLRLLTGGGMPYWSPDGTHIVFHTYKSPQTIDVMKADGTGRETIINHWGSPRWMPHGDRIASIGNNSLLLFDLATGKELNILRVPYFIRPGFAISPDGTHFCFGDERGGVCIGTLDEKALQLDVRLISHSTVCCHAAWSPDGRQVVFGSKEPTPPTLPRPRSPTYQLYLYDAVSDDAPRLLYGQDTYRNNTNPDWSPDGKTIVFSSQDVPLSPK